MVLKVVSLEQSALVIAKLVEVVVSDDVVDVAPPPRGWSGFAVAAAPCSR
jgi:hypothetical protein